MVYEALELLHLEFNKLVGAIGHWKPPEVGCRTIVCSFAVPVCYIHICRCRFSVLYFHAAGCRHVR
jgi:hypothetical protein